MSCEQCFRESRIKPQLTRHPLQKLNEYINEPEDAMHLTGYRDYLRPVALRTLCHPWTCFPANYLHTRHQIRTPKQSLK